MNISLRGWIVVGAAAGVAVMLSILSSASADAQQSAAETSGAVTSESLGSLIKAMGIEPRKVEKRYDFQFKAKYREDEWELSMSAVLSQDKKSVWVMAWLDELPRSAADVPRTALLRLLAQNDQMGNGKFIAYIASNRRFVLQRVVANENITTAKFRSILQDVGASVVETYPYWAVSNWKSTTTPAASQAAAGTQKSGGAVTTGRRAPTQNSVQRTGGTRR